MANGTSCRTATVRTSAPTSREMPPPTSAAVSRELAVMPKVMLPTAASRTCMAAPVVMSPCWTMPSLAPNGPPGEDAVSIRAMNGAVVRWNSAARPHPSSGTTTRLASRTSSSRDTLVNAARSAASVEPSPAANMVAAMKITVTALNSRCSAAIGLLRPARWCQSVRSPSQRRALMLGRNAYSPPRDGVVAGTVVGADDGVAGVPGAEEDAVVHPLGLGELELPARVGADEREHESAVGAVVVEDAFWQRRPVGGAAADHAVQTGFAGHGRVAGVGAADVAAAGGGEPVRVVLLVQERVVAGAVGSQFGVVVLRAQCQRGAAAPPSHDLGGQ